MNNGLKTIAEKISIAPTRLQYATVSLQYMDTYQDH